MIIEISKLHMSCLVAVAVLVGGQVGIFCQQKSTPSFNPDSLALSISPEKLRSDGQFDVSSVKELNDIFEDFDLSETKDVPRLYLAKLPKSMKKLPKRGKRGAKATFIKAVLPHILQVNADVLKDRNKLLDLQKKQMGGKKLSTGEKLWVSKLGSHYRCAPKIRTLLAHVDVVPPSLALAQAGLESGWGTSPAALTKNSTFGHMKTSTKVAAFPTLLHNVTAYIHNLNRNKAYKGFRARRAALRSQGGTPSGHALATELTKYSVRGKNYTRDLQNMIKSQNLNQYDKASLATI